MLSLLSNHPPLEGGFSALVGSKLSFHSIDSNPITCLRDHMEQRNDDVFILI